MSWYASSMGCHFHLFRLREITKKRDLDTGRRYRQALNYRHDLHSVLAVQTNSGEGFGQTAVAFWRARSW